MFQLVEELKAGANTLKEDIPNPISLTAGADLFIRYVTTARQEHSVSQFVNLLRQIFILDYRFSTSTKQAS